MAENKTGIQQSIGFLCIGKNQLDTNEKWSILLYINDKKYFGVRSENKCTRHMQSKVYDHIEEQT